jgi:succinyl-diaminopimelate desuccinylase
MEKGKIRQIFNQIDVIQPESIELMKHLIAINSVGPKNGGPGEKEKSDFIKKYLQEIGITQIRDYPAPDNSVRGGFRPNFIATLPGENKNRHLWIITHTDIVPPGDLTKWRHDPYEAVVREGKIYGRGSEDNHQGLVSAVMTACAFLRSGVMPACNIGLIFVADEETGSRFGLTHLLEQLPDLFRVQDLIIIPDAGEPDGRLIEVAEKSIVWIKVKTTGKQVHASTPEQGINAFRASSHLVVELDKLAGLFPRIDPLFSPAGSTFEPTRKEANVPNINTIPGEDIFYLDYRLLPVYQVPDVLTAVRGIADGIEARFKVRIEISTEQAEQAAPATPVDATVVKLLRQGIKEVYGRDARAQGIGGGTVAAILRRRGLPVAVWSTMDEVGHQPNEYCIVDNMVKDAKVFAWCALKHENL